VAVAVREVAARLGNTAAVCRKCYIHPEVIAAYLSGELVLPPAPHALALDGAEGAVLAFLHRRAAARGRSGRQLGKRATAAVGREREGGGPTIAPPSARACLSGRLSAGRRSV
jgi:DNA topoisomerase-1